MVCYFLEQRGERERSEVLEADRRDLGDRQQGDDPHLQDLGPLEEHQLDSGNPEKVNKRCPSVSCFWLLTKMSNYRIPFLVCVLAYHPVAPSSILCNLEFSEGSWRGL